MFFVVRGSGFVCRVSCSWFRVSTREQSGWPTPARHMTECFGHRQGRVYELGYFFYGVVSKVQGFGCKDEEPELWGWQTQARNDGLPFFVWFVLRVSCFVCRASCVVCRVHILGVRHLSSRDARQRRDIELRVLDIGRVGCTN